MNNTNEKRTTETNPENSNEQFPIHKKCGKKCSKVHPTEWAEWYWWCDFCSEEVKHPTRQKETKRFFGEAERLIAPFKEDLSSDVSWKTDVLWWDIERGWTFRPSILACQESLGRASVFVVAPTKPRSVSARC